MTDTLRAWIDGEFEDEALTGEPGLEVRYLAEEERRELTGADLQEVEIVASYGPSPFSAEDFEAAGDDLEFVMRPSAGFDRVDVDAATEHGVVVSHSPQGPRDSVVEGVIGMMISCARGFHEHNVQVRERGYEGREDPPAFDISGATVGIIGLGQIGRRLAEYLDTFGPDLQAHDPYVDPDRAEALGVDLVSLDELLRTSDFVTIHVPLTDETHHMLGEEHFRKMRDSAFLINAARGGVYPDEELARAVREDWIAGAVVDVFEDEPDIDDNPLLELDQGDALLTPHILGNASRDAQRRLHDLIVEGVLSHARGEFPPNILNPEVYDEPVPEDRISEAYRE